MQTPENLPSGAKTGCGEKPGKPGFVTGQDFSRATSATESTWTLAPEDAFHGNAHAASPLSAVWKARLSPGSDVPAKARTLHTRRIFWIGFKPTIITLNPENAACKIDKQANMSA
jgi:hypothetical protein